MGASVCAEPESDPKSRYGTTAYLPYGNGYALGGYGLGYGYGGYGLGYGHYLGKRSAESEPEAKPKSWYGTAYLPYVNGFALGGYGLGYGYGYGLGGYYYGK